MYVRLTFVFKRLIGHDVESYCAPALTITRGKEGRNREEDKSDENGKFRKMLSS